jgi:hypothetical protein
MSAFKYGRAATRAGIDGPGHSVAGKGQDAADPFEAAADERAKTLDRPRSWVRSQQPRANMSNPYITRDQLMEAVEQLPTPIGIIGGHHVVEVSSLERQHTRIINGVVDMAKLERIEFELVEYGSKPTPMWKFVGDIHLNAQDKRDTDTLQLLVNVVLGAKGVQITKHTPLRATVTALFRKRSSKRFRRPLMK